MEYINNKGNTELW